MDNRIYGIVGIKSIMANWNADFTGYPKTTSNGDTFGSDKAFKHPQKVMWDKEGKKVLYIKSLKLDEKKNVVAPRSLKERYEFLFNVPDLKKEKKQDEVVRNLFTAIDVKQFGATFAEEGNNIGITGAVQIGQGFNKYEDTYAEEQQILSPFVDAKAKEKNKDGEDAKATSLGTKIVSNEAHYFYPFVINPLAYKEFQELGVTEGYTEEDYENFKKTVLVSATAFATNSKAGCENEFALFVETESELYLPNLAEYIRFVKEEGEKNIIEINCSNLINSVKENIKNIEIYYNQYTTEIKCEIEGIKKYNIFTQKEV